MKFSTKPLFIIKKNLQKSEQTGNYFDDVITEEVLQDVCYKLTGEKEFDFEFVDNEYEDEFLSKSYNKGRIATLRYKSDIMFISFSEKEIGGRNSSVQSIPTAFNIYYNINYPNKKLYYYFLDHRGNAETDYLIMIYRLMKTIGFKFLNMSKSQESIIRPFNSVDDIMRSRKLISQRNPGNRSSYIIKNKYGKIEIYGKTYGANKYETTLMSYAICELVADKGCAVLYEMTDRTLKELPKSCINTLRKMGLMNIVKTDVSIDNQIFTTEENLRSPRYIFNLLEKYGDKKCALCGCEISELVQGAHVWNVYDIKKETSLSLEEKVEAATSGENGLWLCQNHHALFDANIIYIDNEGNVNYRKQIDSNSLEYIKWQTLKRKLDDVILTDEFLWYLSKRNANIQEEYVSL